MPTEGPGVSRSHPMGFHSKDELSETIQDLFNGLTFGAERYILSSKRGISQMFKPSEVKKITGASRHETVQTPFYYAPPFLDELREQLESLLKSRGGRPTLEGADLIRKVRFSKDNWSQLQSIAKKWSQSGVSISPAQMQSG